MEVVEKSIGTCRRWNRKKLICRVITLLIQSIETQFFIVWGLIMIIQHHLNKQSAGESIPQWVGRERFSVCSLLLLWEHWPWEKRNGAHISVLVLSARPEHLTERLNHSEKPAWKAGQDLALCQPWVPEQPPLLETGSCLKRHKTVKSV